MALGNANNNGQQQEFAPTYYSRLRFKNQDDNLSMSFSVWKGVLKITVSISREGGKSEEIASINLSPVKAKMFAKYVTKMIMDPEDVGVYGINTGLGETVGLLTIGRDSDGVTFITVGKVNGEGKFEFNQKFRFRSNYNYAIKLTSVDDLASHQRLYDNEVELTMFRDCLEDFARSASGVLAASVHDVGRYETGKINTLIRKLAEANGISSGGNGTASSYRSGGNSYFANNGGNGGSGNGEGYSSSTPRQRGSNYESLENLEDALG